MQIIIHLQIFLFFLFYFLFFCIIGPTPVNSQGKKFPFPFSLSFQILSWMMSWQQTQFRPFYLDHEKSIVAPQLRVIFTSGKHAEGSNPFSLCSAVVSDSCRGLRHKKKTPNKTKTCCCPWCETRGVRLLSTSAHKRE